MSAKISIIDANKRLESSERVIDGNFLGWDYHCTLKCINCNNVQSYCNFKSALRGKCHNCNDVKAHRGNQSVDKFNKSIFKFGWIVEGEYKGGNNPCNFKCLKCDGIQHISQAKSIRIAQCKNCVDNICLNCGNKFVITNEKVYKTTRAFCYDCLPESTVKGKGKYAYIKLYRNYVLKLVKERYGTSCKICGYDKCYSALDFHHVNPDEKEYSPTALIYSNKRIEEIIKELDKCTLICSNCHREIHDKERNESIGS